MLRVISMIAVAIGCAAGAQADAVRFDNYDQTFDWEALQLLDVRLSAAEQTGVENDQVFANVATYDHPYNPHYYIGWLGNWDTEVYSGEGDDSTLAEPVPAGWVVSDAVDWRDIGDSYLSAFSNLDVFYDPIDYITNLPYGEPAFLAVRWYEYDVDLDEFFIYYGWIEVVLDGEWDYTLDALSWGYETTPNTAIAAGYPPRCSGDVNLDDVADLADLSVLLTHFGLAGLGPQGDLSGDGVVDLTDLSMLLANFGIACEYE